MTKYNTKHWHSNGIFTFLANGAHLRCRWGGNPLGFARPFASHTQKRQRVSQLSWSSHCEQIRIGFVRGFCLKQSDPNIGNPAVELSDKNHFNPSTSNIFSNFTAFFIHIWKTLSTTPRDSLCFNHLLGLNHPISQGKPPNERWSSRFRRLGRKKHETIWYLKNVWEFWPQIEYIHIYIYISPGRGQWKWIPNTRKAVTAMGFKNKSSRFCTKQYLEHMDQAVTFQPHLSTTYVRTKVKSKPRKSLHFTAVRTSMVVWELHQLLFILFYSLKTNAGSLSGRL